MLDHKCCKPAAVLEDKEQPEELRYCFNVNVSTDNFYRGKQDCFSFTRSDPICTKDDTREQMNALSAFIDAGALYGSDPDTASKLRTGSDGLMKTHRLGPTLPTRGEAGLKGPDTVQYSVQCVQ